jgi:UDP-N-acetylglucosamine acyltransferase
MATLIHPTAIVPSSAVIADGCLIGPYCVIGEHVSLGPGCVLHSHVIVDGHTEIGGETEIFPCACLGKKTQDLKYKGGVTKVRIGSRCAIREYVTVHSATGDGDTTIVGDDCLIQAYSHVAHDCVLGNSVIVSGGTMVAGHVHIGDGAVVSGMCGIVQFVRIGTLAFIGGYSKLSLDALPYCITDGIPAATVAVNKIGMERHGKGPDAIRAVAEALKLIMFSTRTVDEIVPDLERDFAAFPEVQDMVQFLRTCERGLARPKNVH